MTIQEAKAAVLAAPRDRATQVQFGEALHAAVENAEQVIMTGSPAENGGLKPHMYKGRGQVWAVLYTAPERIKTSPLPKVITADINKVIDIVYSNPHIAGFVMDPESEPVYVTRRDINANTDRKDPRMEPRDWGDGIPQYTRQDLMVIEELMDFAMEEVEEQGLLPAGFEILDANASSLVFPNFVARKDEELYFVLVEVAIAPVMAELNPEKRKAFMHYADQCHAHALYASVGIGSRDMERFSKSLALCGDGFMVNFAGFIDLDEQQEGEKAVN